jgi:hypothetical protein
VYTAYLLNYNNLKDKPRAFLAATGLTLDEFMVLLPAFQSAYDHRYPPTHTRDGQPRQRRAGGGTKGVLHTVADQLLFILVYQKTNPLQTMHGVPCNVRQLQTNDGMHHVLPVVHDALASGGMQPEREASRVSSSH